MHFANCLYLCECKILSTLKKIKTKEFEKALLPLNSYFLQLPRITHLLSGLSFNCIQKKT